MYDKKDLLKWYNESYCLEAVKQYGIALRYINNQTDEICLIAVKQDGRLCDIYKKSN